jgi:hypothetical protein
MASQAWDIRSFSDPFTPSFFPTEISPLSHGPFFFQTLEHLTNGEDKYLHPRLMDFMAKKCHQ